MKTTTRSGWMCDMSSCCRSAIGHAFYRDFKHKYSVCKTHAARIMLPGFQDDHCEFAVKPFDYGYEGGMVLTGAPEDLIYQDLLSL